MAFHYDLTARVNGTVIRDDRQSPFVTLIQLDDGRVVEGGECQFHVLDGDGDGDGEPINTTADATAASAVTDDRRWTDQP